MGNWSKKSSAKTYYPVVATKLRREPPNNDIYPQLERAAATMGVTISTYVKFAIYEKLKNEGYEMEELTIKK